MCLTTTACVYAQLWSTCYSIPISNFMELHALIQATRSYALLHCKQGTNECIRMSALLPQESENKANITLVSCM